MRLSVYCSLVFMAAPLLVEAREVAKWEAGAPPVQKGCSMEAAAPGSEWRIEAGYARLAKAKDYYSQAAYKLKCTEAGTPGWMVVEYLDKRYGIITVSPGVGYKNTWGAALVNSGKVRRTVFKYDKLPSAVALHGLDYLKSITYTDEQPKLEQAPLVEPAIKFSRHSERVSSVAGDSIGPDGLAEAQAGLRNELPLVRALGFNGVETYVRWGWVERNRGTYDWSYYDGILDEIEKAGLQWFPMLLAGSGYALPEWLHDGKDNYGFKCLEHGIVHDTQSIFHPFQTEYSSKFIAEFGKHYRQRKSLLGIRLGPSGDYGEAQYPAKGPGYKFKPHHTHIGYWAADDMAQADFRKFLKAKYGDIAKLNAAWNGHFESFDAVKTFLPQTAMTPRQRVDFGDWYFGAMSDWCEKWAKWSREALPNTMIHQSSGGWGMMEVGTDYSYQARSMAQVKGGIRLTNEGDDFPDNFTITRMANSAARFYGAQLGYEPGGYGSKRGVMSRLFNATTTGAVHLFYYMGNLTANDHAIDAWLKYGKMLDDRAKPVIDVAMLYPDSAVKLDDEVVRYRWGSILYSVARTVREQFDFDYASEQMIADGALDRYKMLVYMWGAITEKSTLEKIDAWVKKGGVVVFSQRSRGLPATVEGDTSIAQRWLAGDTGKGKAIQWPGDQIPAQSYAEFLKAKMLELPNLSAATKFAIQTQKPDRVFWSVLDNGKLALLNFTEHPASVMLLDGRKLNIAPYEPAMVNLSDKP